MPASSSQSPASTRVRPGFGSRRIGARFRRSSGTPRQHLAIKSLFTPQRSPEDPMITDIILQPWLGESAVVADRILNEAIVDADITRSYEEYLQIVDRFYADDVEISSDAPAETVRGKERMKSALLTFLGPLHMMAEIAGLDVSITESRVPSDLIDVQHSEWSLELVGVTGRSVKATWCVRRTWKGSRVVNEYHFVRRQVGEPLSLGDLRVAMAGDLPA